MGKVARNKEESREDFMKTVENKALMRFYRKDMTMPVVVGNHRIKEDTNVKK